MQIKHGTLVADAVTTVVLASDVERVEITNMTGASVIYFTVDGTTPVIAADDTYVLPATINSMLVSVPTEDATVVKLISAGTPDYSVMAVESGSPSDRRVLGGGGASAGVSASGPVASGSVTDENDNVLTVKRVLINTLDTGDNVILALVTSRKLRVLHYFLQARGAVNVEFQDNGTATPRTPNIHFLSDGDSAEFKNEHGLFETASGVGLDLNKSADIDVVGFALYVEVA